MLFSDVSLFVDDDNRFRTVLSFANGSSEMLIKSRRQWPFSTLQSCMHDFVARQEKSHKVRMIDGSQF